MNSQNADQVLPQEPAYLADYGLTRIPFSDLHDDRFLFLDAERTQRLNLLQHLTQYSNLLLIVRAEEGVGKTSLLKRFISNAADDCDICLVNGNSMMDAGQFLYQVAKGFGVRKLPLDSGDLQGLLYDHIATFHHRGRAPILIVDDAQVLPRDALQAIYHLADARVDNHNLLRIMLFAEPRIDKMLNARDLRALRERVTHRMEIPPLNEQATAEYLKHRLAVAGFSGSSPFTPDMVKRIYIGSAGIPARINQLALDALDKGEINPEAEETFQLQENQPGRRGMRRLIIVAVILLVLGLVFQQRISRLLDGNPQSRTIPLPVNVEPSTPDVKPDPGEPSSQVSAAPASNEVGEATPELQEKIIPLQVDTAPSATDSGPEIAVNTSEDVPGEPAVPGEAAKSTASQVQVETDSPALPPQEIRLQSLEPNPVPASDQQQTLTIRGEGFTPDSHVFVSWTDHDVQVPPGRVKFVNSQEIQVALTVGSGDEKWQLRVNDAAHGNSNSLAFHIASPAGGTGAQANDWVLAQSPDAFTLQLFGSRDLDNARAFISQHKLDKAHYFVSTRQGGNWYSVVYGVYPDASRAQGAVDSLPASLARVKPWVRRFDDIQASIHTAGKMSSVANKPPQKPAVAQTASAPRNANVEQNESWIWSQDPSKFTLQLMGARDDNSIRNFLQRYSKLEGNLVYFHSRHAGQDWYAVIYGVYADKARAHDAIARLPEALQKARPWVRSFASIHAELARTE